MKILGVGLLCLGVTAAQAAGRAAQEHRVDSDRDPQVKIELPASAHYVGRDAWLMERYADRVELFAFVQTDGSRRVQKLHWVQFEAYLPSRPELKHTYGSKRHLVLDGMDFLVDSWVTSTDLDDDDPDSDSAHLKGLLGGNGYTLPKSMMSVRLVHLMDGNRKELMYIYSEKLAPTGYSAAQLAPHGSAYGHWPKIEVDLVKRAEQSIKIH